MAGYGNPIEIGHTSELKPGDIIFVEFPALSLGRLKFGESEAFTVIRIDGNGAKVIAQTSSGEETIFDGGSKEDLLRKLGEQTSFTNVSVHRPMSGAQEDLPAPDETLEAPAFDLDACGPAGIHPLLMFAGVLGAGAVVASLLDRWRKK